MASSISSLNSGCSLSTSCTENESMPPSFSLRALKLMGFVFFEARAAPVATKSWEFSGKTTWSSLSPSVSMNLFLSSERKYKGPPRKATFPLIGLPQARPLMVWFTTDWNTDAAMSSFAAPSLSNGCISLLAKTPHLAAIGYMILCFAAISLSPAASV